MAKVPFPVGPDHEAVGLTDFTTTNWAWAIPAIPSGFHAGTETVPIKFQHGAHSNLSVSVRCLILLSIYFIYFFIRMDRYVCRFIYVMRTGGRATHGRVYTYLSICPFVRLSFFYSILQTKISGHFRTDSVSFWPLPPPGVAQSCPSTPVSDRCRDATCRCCGPRQCLFYSGVARTTWRKCCTVCLCFRHTRCRAYLAGLF